MTPFKQWSRDRNRFFICDSIIAPKISTVKARVLIYYLIFIIVNKFYLLFALKKRAEYDILKKHCDG